MGRQTRTNSWYDLHCHVLPGIDDGCKSSDESIQLLREDWNQGVCGVIATPHYYPQESIMQFLERRSVSAERLRSRIRETDEELPHLCLGAEVAYHIGLSDDRNIEKLCLGKSRYLLLELPFSRWSSTVLRDIRKINGRGITPIIAHVERYIGYQTSETAQELFESNVLIQVNAESLLGWKGRGVRKLVRQGKVDVLSSDAHNLTSRRPNLGKIMTQMMNGRLHDEMETIAWQNQQVFRAVERGEGI